MIKKYKNFIFIILLLFLFGCNISYNDNFNATKRINIDSDRIVPIKLPPLPYVLKFNINNLSFNEIDNNELFSFNKVGIMLTSTNNSRKKPVGHKIEGAEYHDELWEKITIESVDNNSPYNDSFGQSTIVNDENLFGVCEIVKFNNQIRRETRNRCFGYLYFQIKVTKKGKRYVRPKFKIKNADGLRMEFFSEKFPELYGVDENEVVEGYIYVSDQEYSDTYELTITQ